MAYTKPQVIAQNASSVLMLLDVLQKTGKTIAVLLAVLTASAQDSLCFYGRVSPAMKNKEGFFYFCEVLMVVMDNIEHLLEKIKKDVKEIYPKGGFSWEDIKRNVLETKYQELSDEEKKYIYEILPKSLGLF